MLRVIGFCVLVCLTACDGRYVEMSGDGRVWVLDTRTGELFALQLPDTTTQEWQNNIKTRRGLRAYWLRIAPPVRK